MPGYRFSPDDAKGCRLSKIFICSAKVIGFRGRRPYRQEAHQSGCGYKDKPPMITMLIKKDQEPIRHEDEGYSCACSLTRRRFLTGTCRAATVVGAAVLTGHEIWAQGTEAKPDRLDIHSHYAPPAWASVVDAKKSKGMFGNANPLGS